MWLRKQCAGSRHTRTVVGGTITTQEVESLPNSSRSPLDLIFTLGGVSEEALSTRGLAEDRTSAQSTPEESGNFSLSGGPAYSNNITIDGLDNNDDRSARERMNPSLDAIEEVQIIRNHLRPVWARVCRRINLRTRAARTNSTDALTSSIGTTSSTRTLSTIASRLGATPVQEHNPGGTLSAPSSAVYHAATALTSSPRTNTTRFSIRLRSTLSCPSIRIRCSFAAADQHRFNES